MSFKINTAKIAGNPDDEGCSQSYDIKPENPAKSATHGDVHLSVSIKEISDNSQSIFVIRGIVAQIQKKFYDNTEDSVLNALSNAITSTLDTYQKEIEIAAAALLNGNAFIVTYGTAEVMLRRKSQIAVFSSPNGAVFKSAGKLQPDDVLVLATKEFVNSTAAEVLNAALEKDDPKQMVELLAPSIQATEKSSIICASFLQVKQQDISPELSSNTDYPKINSPFNNEKPIASRSVNTLPTQVNESDDSQKGLFSKIKSKRFYIKDFSDERENKRRKLLSLAGIVLILMLSGTIVYGLQQKKEKERIIQIETIVTTIEKDLAEAEDVFSYSPQRSQELVQRSVEELRKLEDPELDAQDQFVALSEKISQSQSSVLGMHSAEANDFLDLDLLSSGFAGKKMIVYNQQIYILDTDNNRLISVGVTNKRSEIIAGPDTLEGVRDVAVWSNDIYVLKKDGIYDLENNKYLDSSWGNDALIKGYAGNLYILDKQESEIIRFLVSNNGLNSRTEWLSDEVSADFSRIVSWSIDGAIWLSSESGSVFKYTYGYQQNFELGKIAPELTEAGVVYADSANENVYLLDKKNARILVFAKDGTYKEQYNEEIIKDALDLAVFEEERKIILLTGNKLKYIEIKK